MSYLQGITPEMVCRAIKIFFSLWVIFVPIIMTSRLERIIKLLEEKK